jgi:hypothetical protein
VRGGRGTLARKLARRIPRIAGAIPLSGLRQTGWEQFTAGRGVRDEPAVRVVGVALPPVAGDDRQLGGDVDGQRPDDHVGQGVVHLAERERPRVPLVRVEQAGDDLDDRRGHEHRDRQPLEQVQHAAHRRNLHQGGHDGVELREQQRDDRDAGRDVQALRELVQLRRTGREPHPAERFLEQVAVDPGAEADQERDAEQTPEHHRRAGVAVGGRQSCSSVVQQALEAG